MKYFQFIAYDVWENEDGFNVNDMRETGYFLKSIPDYPSEAKMIAFLKRSGFLRPRFRFNFDGCYTDAYFLNYTKTGMPIGEFRELDKEEFEQQSSGRWSFTGALQFENARIGMIRK